MPAAPFTLGQEATLPATISIIVTRTVRLRGREIERGEVLAAERVKSGFNVAHPSGIEGALAFVPNTHAAVWAFEIERGIRGW